MDSSVSGAVITPNTLSTITALVSVITANGCQRVAAAIHSPFHVSHHQITSNSLYTDSTANSASTAADGPFLLSQATRSSRNIRPSIQAARTETMIVPSSSHVQVPPTEKAWLAQLRAKNMYLTQANQRSQEALISTHEELARLTVGTSSLPVGAATSPPPNTHPVSISGVSLP
ncbi:hypothetical protein BC826DRAFT_316413 [Russula brevipes]|nr:hypothetical protein BC826DRAFT_316413 [Russula brevipes]